MPVIYLTSHDDHATVARAKVAEPYGFLLKPSTDRELQITIELAVYRHAAERERERVTAPGAPWQTAGGREISPSERALAPAREAPPGRRA